MATTFPQPLLPEALIERLINRGFPPRLRCDADGCWQLELPGQPPRPIDLADHDPVERAIAADLQGVEVIPVRLPAELGIETLPPHEAEPLIAAFTEGILALGPPFALWDPAPVALAA